jgi:hypothetical protein
MLLGREAWAKTEEAMEEPHRPVAKPLAKNDVEQVLIDQELFLHDHNDGSLMHCLNSGAALIWYLCDGTRDVQDIAEEIADTFSLPQPQVLAEVQDTVTQFQSLGLLELGPTETQG